ncbi:MULTISPECIES: acetylxylan esterase [unclassified Arthrobacter]|uniref:acetylxylan esterase n=1 Tax=unclassified Arthrobacter TaxID=235627 RepID=UPI001490F95C|nr:MULTISPECIES: acetylxylan esterase [unclassified Arthrobacter]MBE0010369.1 acetylesterase [Arthrobacter sp. AET 35A]NOJ64308.1 acetylesterase [Arthrobacter sp. 147(2020)]
MAKASAIGGYEDWPAFMTSRRRFAPASADSERVANVVGVPALPAPDDSAYTVTRSEESVVGGVRVSRLGWQLPFGPPTSARLVTPLHHEGRLPGLLWMHCHGGNKWLGGERLVDLGQATDPDVVALQRKLYEGRAVANDFARAGFAVLVHDAFSWGSRRFVLDPAPERAGDALRAATAQWTADGDRPSPELTYNTLAAQHENTVAKAAALLGTSYAGMVAYDDLVALAILRQLPEVDPDWVGVGGFSGGGGRALMLAALDQRLTACVVSCMMTTHESLFPAYLESHSWLLSTPGLAAVCDWPALSSLAPTTRFLVQYALDDPLFPAEGMRDADRLLRDQTDAGPEHYRGAWHPGGHIFTAAMLAEAGAHLSTALQEGLPGIS